MTGNWDNIKTKANSYSLKRTLYEFALIFHGNTVCRKTFQRCQVSANSSAARADMRWDMAMSSSGSRQYSSR